jgi:DNA-binding LytR/AlgR family response regulator
MTRTSILIVEDEPIIADDIAFIIKDLGYDVCGLVSTVEDALASIQKFSPSLVLVDINLEGQQDGIDLGGMLHSKFKLPFIYLTSYYDDQTVNRAKLTNPSGYVIKPFDERDLKVNLEIALHKPIVPDFKPEKFFVKNNQELIALDPKDILMIEAIDNYAYVYSVAKKYMISHTLKSIEEKLSHQGFVRIHKSFLINFRKIDSISEGLVFIGTHKVPIGKSYRQNLLDYIVTL